MGTDARSTVEQAIAHLDGHAPPHDEFRERAAIGGVLTLARPFAELAVKQLTKDDFHCSLRGELWGGIREAWKVETRWRSTAAIMFALTRCPAWKRCSHPYKYAELFACVNVNTSHYDWPHSVRCLSHLRKQRAKLRGELMNVVRALWRLEQLESESGITAQVSFPMTGKEYYDAHKDDRQAWARAMPPICMVCRERKATDTHEIERKGQAPKRWAHRCNYLRVCRFPCHDQAVVNMPHAVQLAYKLLSDAEHFDLNAWNAIRNRQVTMAEVMEHVYVILGVRT